MKKDKNIKIDESIAEDDGAVIKKENIEEALKILSKYRDGKRNLERRIIDNEQWFKLRHWEQLRGVKESCDNASAWLFNSIANKHADAMDSFPCVNCLPREESDKKASEVLSQVLPIIFERNDFEKLYSDAWWYKLKAGTAVYGIFWNSQKNGGLGDIEIVQTDILDLFWEPGIKDIKDSKNLFHIRLEDNDTLIKRYPALSGKTGHSGLEVSHFIYDDTVDTSEKSAVVDWYYKVWKNGRVQLHYCKFCCGEILYASENDPVYRDRGFYNHGEYPFVFDSLFVEEGTPCGFGYIDIMKDAQKQIDTLGNSLVKAASLSSVPRFFINSSGAVNEEEFADWSNSFVHVNGANLGEDSIREIRISSIPEICLGVLNNKIDELKETSGNRDFSQGGVASGVTAASAIAALQEAGSKLTRDMVKGGYRAFVKLNILAIELIRQFYDEPRFFRIVGENGREEFITYDNRAIRPKKGEGFFENEIYERVPIFDIKVTSEKSSPFSKISQNELALQLFGAGMFNPELKGQALTALSMMDFEGKSTVINRIAAGEILG